MPMRFFTADRFLTLSSPMNASRAIRPLPAVRLDDRVEMAVAILLDRLGHLEHVFRRRLPRRRLRRAEVDQHVLLRLAVIEGEEKAVAEADVVTADLQRLRLGHLPDLREIH